MSPAKALNSELFGDDCNKRCSSLNTDKVSFMDSIALILCVEIEMLGPSAVSMREYMSMALSLFDRSPVAARALAYFRAISVFSGNSESRVAHTLSAVV